MTSRRPNGSELVTAILAGSGWAPWALGALFLAAVVVASAFNGYLGALAINIGIWYLLAAGLNLVIGYSGQFSAGHAMLYGFAAYSVALALRAGVPPLVGLPLAAVVGGAFAFLVAVPFVRLRGPFLAMATFAAQIAFTEVATGWNQVTNGANGLVVRNTLEIGDRPVQGPLLLALVLGCGLLVSAILHNLVRHRFGRALTLMQSSELAAASVGVDIAWHRITAFALSGVLAGVAAFWLIQYVGFIDPSGFDLGDSIALLAAVVIGGRGSTIGPWIGVSVFYLLHSLLASLPTLEALLYGLSVIAVVTVAPGGLWGLLSGFARRRSLLVQEAEREVVADESPETRQDQVRSQGVHEPVIEVVGVSKWFGGLEVLSDVSFNLPSAGSVTALIGPNGAGKTTLLNLLTALDVPNGGTIRVLGSDVSSASPNQVAGLGVARTFQVPRLVAGRSVAENIVMGMHRSVRVSFFDQMVSTRRARESEARAYAHARQLLQSVDLGDWWHRDVADLPHGLRRFVEVARGLAGHPQVLLLDEPAAGLEQSEVDALSRVLSMAAHELGIAVLLIDHNMQLVFETADDVVVLDAGHVIAQGRPELVIADPIVQDAYLGRLTGTEVAAAP